ncbi:prenyltransferase alpha subunit repeat protein [Penicillium hetheringtonii]|uniref:Geranylgeranyl transferase type-2 subunit alpha n=1 Tax=Penicillium hetheringtonii TaxID=911720 RepID=A0AAD6DQF0_9EURO|nr:prenyltransferase alpha subunit repeat protein [Penicillium hetheringtonii]
MASHGIPRFKPVEKTQEERERELKQIEEYKSLEGSVSQKVTAQEYSTETLEQISDLLRRNPEYYTIWNYRRQALRHQFSEAGDGIDSIVQLIRDDLIPSITPSPVARRFWQEELALVGKMLTLDSRNFHGWAYRRVVVGTLKQLGSEEESREMNRQEFDYAKKMIGANLSNFSAWHYRTKLILRLLEEQSASDEERQAMLDDELALIHQALIDPYDQSLWFYHQSLMCVFDPSVASRTMAPNLGTSERLQYLRRELAAIEEMLDGAEDCKYIYQSLIECTMLVSKVSGHMLPEDHQQVLSWLSELQQLDPLRRQRWLDLEKNITIVDN